MTSRSLKILIIDDTPVNLQLLGEALQHKYIVQVATSGEKGLQLAENSPPDLILLDIMMPGMDGFEVCRQLKQKRKLSSIPVIFITALNDVETELQCLSLGAVDFLNKPINIQLACFRIDNFIERERLRREIIMQEQLKLAASVFDYSHDAILISDSENKIVDVNASFSRITGYSLADVIGKDPNVLKSGKHNQAFYQRMWDQLLRDQHWEGELWNKHKHGHLFAVQSSISIITDAEDNIDHYLAIFSDVTLRKTHEDALKKIAYFDELTGIPNRTLLADRMSQAIAQSQRSGKVLAVCYLDLDGFKPVNDQFGHAMGDKLLIQVTQRIQKCLRSIDTLSRIGGDEFVLLLLDLNNADEYVLSIERILGVLREPFYISEHSISVSASIGVTLYPQNNNNADTLLRHADQAMYSAKQKGKNQFCLFDSLKSDQDYEHEKALLSIKQALNNDEFVLFYQPKVNLRNGEVSGFEALIRWQHPQKGLLMPADFLPIIENHALMTELSLWVISTAIEQLVKWQNAGLALGISVNIAPCHVIQSDFAEQLNKQLQKYPELAAGRLELEILETAALDDVKRVCKTMKACMMNGVEFAIDDFGTGYSSLTYLKSLPARSLKIDQSFVRDMLIDSGDLLIIIGTLALAKAFKRIVIAEGVETPVHARKLLEIGCDYAQGYGIARPMPIEEVADWLQKWPDMAQKFLTDIEN